MKAIVMVFSSIKLTTLEKVQNDTWLYISFGNGGRKIELLNYRGMYIYHLLWPAFFSELYDHSPSYGILVYIQTKLLWMHALNIFTI
jgi:hypothetical protein